MNSIDKQVAGIRAPKFKTTWKSRSNRSFPKSRWKTGVGARLLFWISRRRSVLERQFGVTRLVNLDDQCNSSLRLAERKGLADILVGERVQDLVSSGSSRLSLFLTVEDG